MGYKLSVVLITSVLFIKCTTSTSDLYREAEELMDKGKYKEAIGLYNKIVKRNPKFEDAYYFKGYCYLKDSNYTKALRHFKHVLDLKGYSEGDKITVEFHANNLFNPEAAEHEIPIGEIFYQLGVVRYYTDSISASFHSFQRAIDRNYEKDACFTWQGLLWLRADSLNRACDLFQKGVNLNNKDAIELIKQYCGKIQ